MGRYFTRNLAHRERWIYAWGWRDFVGI
jgi:hypothetical protein